MKDKGKFINSVLLSMNESSAERSEKVKAEIGKLKKRNAELDQMYIRLYEDYSSGKLSEKKFTMMSAHYEQEQDANEEKLTFGAFVTNKIYFSLFADIFAVLNNLIRWRCLRFLSVTAV